MFRITKQKKHEPVIVVFESLEIIPQKQNKI